MIITNLEKKIGDLDIKIPLLNFEKGKIHGLLGGNGCGKSTLAKIIIGQLEIEKGKVDLEGVSKEKIALMSQRPYMLQRSVYENIIYPLQIKNMNIDEKDIENKLEKIGLLHKKNEFARTLSSGEQQKLSFLRALIFKPEIVIVDETLSNLDPESLSRFENWILDWHEQENNTWIIISHQMIQINNLCSIVHFMKKGEIVESGSKEEVLYNSPNKDVNNFVQYQILKR